MKIVRQTSSYLISVQLLLLFSNEVPTLANEVKQPINMVLSRTEIAETQKALSRITDGNIPSGFEGGILFDGIVLNMQSKHTLEHGYTGWHLKPEHIYVGKEMVTQPPIEILSTANEKQGGVRFEVGKRYRVFAIVFPADELKEGKRFLTWKGIVIPLKHRPHRHSKCT